jgi:plastocyanin
MTTTSKPGIVQVAALAAVLLAAVLLALGTATAFAAPAAAATHSVVIKQYSYGPGALSISQGDTVTWTNQDSVEHDVTVTKGPMTFHSPMLAKGQSWSHTFTAAGSYSYICSVHPDMRATVTVKPKPTPKPTPESTPAATMAAPAAPRHSAAAPATPHSSASSPHPTQTQAAVAAEPTTQLAESVSQPDSTLDPLLLVAGVSTAVMVFCLLLMTSRPARRDAEPPADA